jgi:uncharacterized protein YidB (DUF937 family)
LGGFFSNLFQEDNMGLLDSVIGAAMGGGNQGGGNAALLNMVVGMLTGGGGAAPSQGAAPAGGGLGGLGGLLEQLQRSGLGDVANSWVGTGQNQQIAPDQLGNALGNDTISSMAGQLGMNHGDLLSQLSQMLPQVVDKLTPQGQVPQKVDAGGLDLGSILGSLMKR